MVSFHHLTCVPICGVLHAAGIPALRMQHWLKSSFTEESDDSARADMARKPDPFFPASAHSSPALQRSNGARPAAPGAGASPAAPQEADCEQSRGESAADWVLSALSKSSSQNGASQRSATNGSASSSGSTSNNAGGSALWLPGSKQRVINLDTAAGSDAASALDPEPWVHNGAAGSGAEALARATLRSASAPVDVPSAGLSMRERQAPEQRQHGHRLLRWGRHLAGHTDDEASSSDESSSDSQDAVLPPDMFPDAAASPGVDAASELPATPDVGSQRRADGSADYII